MARWEEAEKAVCEWMRHHGYPDAELTAGGPDGGVDIRSAVAVAQVKDQSRPVSAPLVQALFGIATCERRTPLLFSSDGFTPDARAFADRTGVALFDISFYGRISPANRHA
jgi:hypothetical protein